MLSHERIVSSRVTEAVEAAHGEERAHAQVELQRLHDVHAASLQELEAKLQLERVGAAMMAGEEARKTTEAEKRAQVAAARDRRTVHV